MDSKDTNSLEQMEIFVPASDVEQSDFMITRKVGGSSFARRHRLPKRLIDGLINGELQIMFMDDMPTRKPTLVEIGWSSISPHDINLIHALTFDKDDDEFVCTSILMEPDAWHCHGTGKTPMEAFNDMVEQIKNRAK